MAKKQAKAESKTKAIAKRDEVRKISFAGAQRLMTKPTTKREEEERKILLLTSQALAISPFGVNILGNLPYTNNIGRKEKMQQYDPGVMFEHRWVKRSETDDDKAICEARVVKNGKPLSDWVVGECSPKTIKMGPLQGYQNHMAQTRAENRAFEAAYGNKVRIELFQNVQRLLSGGLTDEKNAAKALNAGGTSAEEAVNLNQPAATAAAPEKKTKITEDDMNKIKAIIKSTGSVPTLIDIDKKIEASPIYTKVQKEELHKIILTKADEIDSKQN